MLQQQRLFEHYNPLEQKVGAQFFEKLPKEPGIYKMFGSQERLLYVGKAKNLRNRLFTYRRARMETTSRKTIRLIRMTHRIEIECCDSEKEALLLENKHIRKHRPEFNYAKTQPETYYFIGMEVAESGIFFQLRMHKPELENVYGAFKGHRLVRKSLGGLIRILYILEQRVESVFGLPSVLTRKLTPMEYLVERRSEDSFLEAIFPDLWAYFLGIDMALIERIMEEIQERKLLESFAGSMMLDDLESIRWFFERCSKRNFQVKELLGLDPNAIIPQHKLDDYLIEWAFEKESE